MKLYFKQGYDRGSYNVLLIEDGQRSLKRFPVDCSIDDDTAFKADLARARKERDAWLKDWVEGRVSN